ncbi:MAG: hypothetical protein OXG41_04745 [Acidimicrobiaceae bacterium]|nr:hypothetical protein [Acidimicrobiaceae bacterium]
MTDVKLRSGSGLSDASRNTPAGASMAADTWRLADRWGLSESLRQRLVEVYGRAPRRVSHLGALSLGGVALMAGVTISASGALYGRARRLGWRHVAESPATLLVAATEAGDATWMSTPVRALLECAQHARWVFGVEEVIAQALSKTPRLFDPEELATVATDLRFAAGLRRIASVADALTAVAADSSSLIPAHARAMVAVDRAYGALCERARPGERWLGLDPNEPRDAAVMWDRRRRVWWHTTPAELAEHLLY